MYGLYTQILISAPWRREVLLEEQGKNDHGGTKPHTSFARCKSDNKLLVKTLKIIRVRFKLG